MPVTRETAEEIGRERARRQQAEIQDALEEQLARFQQVSNARRVNLSDDPITDSTKLVTPPATQTKLPFSLGWELEATQYARTTPKG